jgi:radical SAM superfamily enzyme YgiQ (UPF0313 family)
VSTPRFNRHYRDTRRQPPLSFAYIGAYLEERNITCSVIDGYSFDYDPKEIVKEVITIRPRFLGITVVSEDRFNAIQICRQVKAECPEIFIIAGGPHFGYSAVDAMKHIPEIDFVISGEGEITFYELITTISSQKGIDDFQYIKGLTFRRPGGSIVENQRRTSYLDFNTVTPAWHLFDMDKYKGGLCLENRTRAIGLISSRGCFNNCAFCANALTRKVRYKDPVLFVDEIEELVNIYDFPGINIQDDSFSSNIQHVTSICNEILSRKIQFRWYCSLRVNEANKDLLRLMKDAGCIGLGFGIESGSDIILRNINKGTDTQSIYDAVRTAIDIGFEEIGMFVLTSLPGETNEIFMESQRYLNKLYSLVYPNWKNQPILGSLTLLYPGTALEQMSREMGTLPQNFSWNKDYFNPKSDIFHTNPCMPYFENRDFSIEKIYETIHEIWDSPEIFIC